MERTSGTGPKTVTRIVREIWRNPDISRIEIAERLLLDKSTVTNQVNRLIDIGLIMETSEGTASTRGGRRPICLEINRKFGHVIGIELQIDSYTAIVADLSGNILGEYAGKVTIREDTFQDAVLKVIGDVTANRDMVPGKLLGIGVGAGGLIDRKRGIIRYSVPLGIKNTVDFGRLVSSRLDVLCLVENDANCCAWGELAFNHDMDKSDFLFALVEIREDKTDSGFYGLGFGFGIVLGNKVYSGSRGNAGEFRSVMCDGHGMLQLSLSEEILCKTSTDADALQQAMDEFCRNAAMLVNTMDFSRVYIGGNIETLGANLPALLKKRLGENWMYPVAREVEISYSTLGKRAVAHGAAGMILDRMISERMIPALESANAQLAETD